MSNFARSAALTALALLLPSIAAAAATPVSAPQQVTIGELQRYIYAPSYPTWCYQAGEAARKMRVKPSTDPATMHAIMSANILNCANTTYAQQHASLWNTAVFAASAAALIAARNEPPAQAYQDATHAKNWSADIAGFTRADAGASGLNSSTPSMYRTNAGRINTDAVALLAAIQTAAASAPPSTPAPADALPAHAKGAPSPVPSAAH
jgi:hypothetical protein